MDALREVEDRLSEHANSTNSPLQHIARAWQRARIWLNLPTAEDRRLLVERFAEYKQLADEHGVGSLEARDFLDSFRSDPGYQELRRTAAAYDLQRHVRVRELQLEATRRSAFEVGDDRVKSSSSVPEEAGSAQA